MIKLECVERKELSWIFVTISTDTPITSKYVGYTDNDGNTVVFCIENSKMVPSINSEGETYIKYIYTAHYLGRRSPATINKLYQSSIFDMSLIELDEEIYKEIIGNASRESRYT